MDQALVRVVTPGALVQGIGKRDASVTGRQLAVGVLLPGVETEGLAAWPFGAAPISRNPVRLPPYGGFRDLAKRG